MVPRQTVGTRQRGALHRMAIRWAAVGGVTAVLTCVAFVFDGYLLPWFDDQSLPGDVRKAIHLSEAFAHGFGVLAILLTLWVATEGETRRRVAAAALITLVCGGLGNLTKGLFLRVRPHAAQDYVLSTGWGVRIAIPIQPRETAEELPFRWRDSRIRAFPSGHAATAWGLAIGLTIVAPRGLPMFILLAIVASLQRVFAGAHYMSDVLAGASLAMFSGALLLRWPVLAHWLHGSLTDNDRERQRRSGDGHLPTAKGASMPLDNIPETQDHSPGEL
ncbi:MAG: hypothetical protein KatS3mg111_3509 [Pirellulaceae bacterium]|nr:MAG: hypothetical protein KatS3mg111_3509 [Pirellulaceae bacterium]